MIVTNLPNCYGLLRRLLDPDDLGSFVSYAFRRKSSQSSAGTTLELEKHPHPNRGSRIAAHGRESDSTETMTRADHRLRIWQQKHFAVENSASQEGIGGSNPSDLQHPSFQAIAKGPSSIDFGKDDRVDAGHVV